MKKCMNTNYSDNQCKDCKEQFSTSKDLQQHVADKHSKKPVKLECAKAKDAKNVLAKGNIFKYSMYFKRYTISFKNIRHRDNTTRSLVQKRDAL